MRLRRYEPLAEDRRVQGMSREQACQRFFGRITRRAGRMIEQAGLEDRLAADDLVACGMLGLLEAFERFADGHDADFDTFAAFRIAGAMRDAVTAEECSTRRERQITIDVSRAADRLTAENGRPPEHREVAAALRLSLSEYWRQQQIAEPTQMASLSDVGAGAVGVEPAEGPRRLLARDERKALREALARLPERECLVVQLYSGRDCSLAEVGAILKVSPSRVCQLLTDARARLRKLLGRVDVELFSIEEMGAA